MSGKALPALFCVPVLVKDNIDTVGMVTTAGSIALLDNFPQRDAQPVRRVVALRRSLWTRKLHGTLSMPVWQRGCRVWQFGEWTWQTPILMERYQE